jgi:anti-sigma-K factor RskA
MMAEEQQDQAALYALGLLDATEAEEFEARLLADAELRGLTRELTDAAALLALDAPQHAPPLALKTKVLSQIAPPEAVWRVLPPPAPVIRPYRGERSTAWLPWAIAAAVLLFCGVLVKEQGKLRNEVAALRTVDPLGQVSVYNLTVAAPNAPPKAVASVAWDAGRQNGLLRVSGLPVPMKGKDYQLWVIAPDESKEPVSAGLVRVDKNGTAQIPFTPESTGLHPKAFAISMERAGGSPRNQGPIVLVSGT